MFSQAIFFKLAVVAGALDDPEFASQRESLAVAVSGISENLTILGRDAESQNYVIDGDTRVPQGRWAITNIGNLIGDLITFFGDHRDGVEEAYAALLKAGRVSAKDRAALEEIRESAELDDREIEQTLERLVEATAFFQVDGIDDLDSGLGSQLADYKTGRNGKAFDYLVRTAKEREDDRDDTQPFSLSEAFQAFGSEGLELRRFLASWCGEIDDVYAAMLRAKKKQTSETGVDDQN